MIRDGMLYISSKVTASKPRTRSVRTTIPEMIALHHKIEAGTTIVWGMDPRTGNVWLEGVDGKKAWRKDEK